MLNHTFVNALRTSSFRASSSSLTSMTELSAEAAGSRRFGYQSVKVHRTKYKSMAKERRKQMLRSKMGGQLGPRDIGEEQPPFFMP